MEIKIAFWLGVLAVFSAIGFVQLLASAVGKVVAFCERKTRDKLICQKCGCEYELHGDGFHMRYCPYCGEELD